MDGEGVRPVRFAVPGMIAAALRDEGAVEMVASPFGSAQHNDGPIRFRVLTRVSPEDFGQRLKVAIAEVEMALPQMVREHAEERECRLAPAPRRIAPPRAVRLGGIPPKTDPSDRGCHREGRPPAIHPR